MEYKVEELCAYLRASGVSPKSTKLVERLVTRLGWDTFYTAPVAQLNSAYHAERPGSKVGLSSQGVTAVNKARQWMHDKRYNLTVDLENANAEKKREKLAREVEADARMADADAKLAAAKKKLEEAQLVLREAKELNHVFDAKWIKRQADFMELEGIEYVDLRGINMFVASYRGLVPNKDC